MVRVGINGFGRIGRQVLKAVMERHQATLEVAAINDLVDVETNAHLFKYDTNYGVFPGQVEAGADSIVIDGKKIKSFSQRDPESIPWGEAGVDIVVESTGLFRARDKAAMHLKAGAKKVIISAPASDEPDATIVMGVNQDDYDPDKHQVVSNASCTTNCLAPPAKVVNDSFGIEKGLMTTVHAYTGGQRLVDMAHKDLRRARAAAMSIIPTTTGAAKAVALVIPDLAGKFDGYSLRVPTPTVSIVDFVAFLKKDTTTEELRAALTKASEGPMKDILGIEAKPLVSTDFKGDPRSSIVDLQFTQVLGGNMAKVVTWYDNEWGYSSRVSDLAALMAEKGL